MLLARTPRRTKAFHTEPNRSELHCAIAVWESRARDTDTTVALLQAISVPSEADTHRLVETQERSRQEWAEVTRLRAQLSEASLPAGIAGLLAS